MKKDRKQMDLQHESLKKSPFGVPEGYFESFSERLQERIREEESSIPVRRIGSGSRLRLAMAAAVVGLALISYSIIKFTNTSNGSDAYFPDMAVLEQMQVFDDDQYLYEMIEEVEEEMDEEEAFATQAIEYLAMNDAEMLLFIE